MHIFAAIILISAWLLWPVSASAQIIHGSGGGGGGVAGWPSNSATKSLTWADSLANAARLGDSTNPVCIYTDLTKGATVRPCTEVDTVTNVFTNKTWCLFDVEADSCILTVDPDAATPNAKYQFATGYQPLKSAWIAAGALYGDGTNCPSRPTAVIINSGPRIPTFICTDNDSSRLDFSFRMPSDWNGGTVKLVQVVTQTAADTSALNGKIALQCRGTGETVSNTWGTEVDVNITNVTGSNANNLITSGDATPAGTCAAGDMLYGYWRMVAAGTTTAVATLHLQGFHLVYTSNSLSH